MKVPGTFNLLATRLAVPVLRGLGRDKRLPDDPYHLYEYTSTTLQRMFRRHFATVEIRNETVAPWRMNLKSGSFDHVAKMMLQWFNWPLTALTNRFGDRMTVYARKDR